MFPFSKEPPPKLPNPPSVLRCVRREAKYGTEKAVSFQLPERIVELHIPIIIKNSPTNPFKKGSPIEAIVVITKNVA